MKKVNFLRKKYPVFIYKKYFWELSKKNLEIFFDFQIPPEIFFKPKIVIKNVNLFQIKRIGERLLNNLIFNLGLIELLSYWKATCSAKIEIKASPLNQEQIKWWKNLIFKGMGQFFYENKIDFQKPNFLKIITQNNLSTNSTIVEIIDKVVPLNENKILVPIGGGKDSVVTLAILKKAKKNICCFSLNPTKAALEVMKIGKGKKPIIVKRKIDPKLLKLNQKGFLNGHTPFSAYLAFLSTLVAVLFNSRYIVFSNERSSNEGNIKYLGRVINHQYSKSFDFEKKFRKYSKKYLAKNVEYFSFLRPLYDIQIAKLFSDLSEYFPVFLSCNVAYQTTSGSKLPIKKWCGSCPKCLFVFATLYPFIEESKLIKIFGQNLFENQKLLPLMQELIGERKFKPFECIGTKKESLIAFYLSWKNCRGQTPYILKYFEKRILPRYPNSEKESKKLINSWSKQHNLPKEFEKILKASLK